MQPTASLLRLVSSLSPLSSAQRRRPHHPSPSTASAADLINGEPAPPPNIFFSSVPLSRRRALPPATKIYKRRGRRSTRRLPLPPPSADSVAKVCGTLLRRGTLSLQELVRSTELSTSLVKNCLLVLIQHNCVQAFAIPRPTRPGEEKKTTFYMALLHNIIHRSRFNKLPSVARDDAELMEVENLGLENAPKKAKSSAGGASQKPKSVCVALLEGLLQHGRLTFEQLFVRETSKKGNSIGRDEVRADFDRLVHAQYVERWPRPDPVISTDPYEKPARRRGAKISPT